MAARGQADGADELVGARVLEQVAARAGGERLDHVGLVGRDGQDDELDIGTRPAICRIASMPEMFGIFRSITTTSGASSRASATARRAVARLADDGHAVRREHLAQALRGRSDDRPRARPGERSRRLPHPENRPIRSA